MSTYWYFECLDHDPPLRSEAEITQHTDDEHMKANIRLLGRRHEPGALDEDERVWRYRSEIQDGDYPFDAYFLNHGRGFLALHPQCHIGLVNEYNERRSVEAK